jgi:acyl carrier protein
VSPAEHSGEQLTRRIREIAVRILEVDDADLTDTSLFHEDHGADSVNGVEVQAALEQAFDIVLEHEQAVRMINVAATREIVVEVLRGAGIPVEAVR